MLEITSVKINNKLNFDEYIWSIQKKSSVKLNALSRVTKYMSPEKGGLLVSAFFLAQSSHCSLILVFHSGSLSNHKINRLREWCLHIVYNDNYSSLRRLAECWLSVFQYIAGIYSSLRHGCLGSMRELFLIFLTLSWRRPLSWRNQSIG